MSNDETRVEAPGIAAAIYRATRGAAQFVAERVTSGERVIELVGTLPVVQQESLNDGVYVRGDRDLFPTDAEMAAMDPPLMSCKRAIQVLDWRVMLDPHVEKFQYRTRVGAKTSPATLWVRRDVIEGLAAGNFKAVPASQVTAPYGGPGAVVAAGVVADAQFIASSAARRAELAVGVPGEKVVFEAVTIPAQLGFGRVAQRVKKPEKAARR